MNFKIKKSKNQKKILLSLLASCIFINSSFLSVGYLSADASYLQSANNSELHGMLSDLIASGAVPSPTVKIYNALPSITLYEQDLLLCSALYSSYMVQDKLTTDQLALLQKIAASPAAQKAVKNVHGDTQLIEAIKGIKSKNTERPVANSAVPQLPTNGFTRTFKPPTPQIPLNNVPQQQPAKATPPPLDPIPSMNPLADVGVYDAANLRTIKQQEDDLKTSKNKKGKELPLFDFGIEHSFYYRDTKTSGATIYDDENNLDAYGNPTQVKYKNEHSMKQDLIMKLLLNASEATKISFGFRAYNPVSTIGDKTTSYTFDNIVASIKKVNTLTLGRFSESFGNYNVKLDNIKGVKYQYKGKGDDLTLISGKTGQFNDATYSEGNPNNIWGFQYLTSKLINNAKIAFSYAVGAEIADEQIKHRIYTIAFNGNNGSKTNPLEYGGEMNFGKTTTKNSNYVTNAETSESKLVSTDYVESTIKAIYLDTSKSWGKLASTLHIIDISPNYAGFVKDESGNGTYSLPDGTADYPYPAGQKGYDLALGYKANNNINLQAGISRYPYNENNQKNITKNFIAASYVHRTSDKNIQTSQTEVALRYQNNGANGVAGSKITGQVNSAIMLAKNTSLALGFTFANGDDGSSGDERRYTAELQKKWEITQRLALNASTSYERKMRDETDLTTTDYSSKIDSSKQSSSIGLTYQVIPGTLNTSIVFTRSKATVVNPEYIQSTGQNLDGQSEDRSGVMIGIDWQYKAIPGLSLTAGIGKDNVHYYDTNTDSKQDVLTAGAQYERRINANSSASINYDYTAKRDPNNPQYNEIMNEIGADIKIKMNENSNLSINHTKQKIYKANDPDSSSNVTQTTVEMVNKF